MKPILRQLAVLLFVSANHGSSFAQTVPIPTDAQEQFRAASAASQAFGKLDKKRKEQTEAINEINRMLPLLNEWQFLTQAELQIEIENRRGGRLKKEFDPGNPFEFGREQRFTLEEVGMDPKTVTADFAPEVLLICLERYLSALKAREDSQRRLYAREDRNFLQQYSKLVAELKGKDRSIVVDFGGEDQVSRWQLRANEIESEKAELFQDTPEITADPDFEKRRIARISELIKEEEQLRENIWSLQSSGRRPSTDKRTEYQKYVDAQIVASHSYAPTESEKYLEYGKFLIYRDLMQVEDSCRNPTDSASFHGSVIEFYLDQIRSIASAIPSIPEEFQEEILAKSECLAKLAFLRHHSHSQSQSDGLRSASYVESGRILDSIRSPSDAARAFRELTEKRGVLQTELSDQSSGNRIRTNWLNVRLDSRNDWGAIFFNSKARYGNKVVLVELWDGPGQPTTPNSRSHQPNNGGRGGRTRAEGSGGTATLAPESTSLSTGGASRNVLRWKITCDQASLWVTLAAPATLNARNSNRELDPQILEYINHENKLATLDARLAVPHSTIQGVTVFTGPTYRPSFLEDEAFVPTYVTIPWEQYRIGFVVNEVGPGSADIRLTDLLAALLSL